MGIAAILTRILAGPLVDSITDVIKSIQQRKLSEAEARAEVEKVVAATIEQVASTEIQARRDVLIAELRGESWLQRNWRPIVALTAFFSYWFVIIAYPFLHAWDWLPPVRFGEVGLQNMFWLTTVAVGGYIGGRTVEKVVRSIGNASR